jgi:flagellar hook protein FlgE
VQGTLQSSDVNTNLAISGSGMFAVTTGSVNSDTTSSQTLYTRQGDFAMMRTAIWSTVPAII